MSGPLLRFRNAAALAAAIAATACAGGRQGAPAPIPPAPVVATPVPTPREVSIPVPEATAPSGTLLAIGVKSDAKEFVFGTSGAPWILAAGGRADRLRAPLSFAAEGGAASRRWAAQAGAYSQEETARGIADRLARDQGVPASVVFSAERGLYRVLVGDFATREEAAALVERLKAAGEDALVAEGTAATAPATLLVTDETGTVRRVASPADLYPGAPGLKIALDATSYRGSLRVLANARGTINVINRVDLEEYLYGVVPAEMGPKRFDELEALKAQAVAARTYAMAHRGQFASEGYDLCATPKCQVYGGLGVEDPLTTAAVDGTRGLVLASAGKFADALFVSTCGGKTENVENVFGEEPVPYLVAVECGELATTAIEGARLPKGERLRGRSPLEWRGAVLRLRSPRSRAPRGAALATAQDWAGVPRRGVPPAAALDAAAVYPSLVDAFGLASAEHEHLSPAGISYAAETPALSDALSGEPRDAFDFWVRFRLRTAGSPRRSTPDSSSRRRFVSAASWRRRDASSRGRVRISGSRRRTDGSGCPTIPRCRSRGTAATCSGPLPGSRFGAAIASIGGSGARASSRSGSTPTFRGRRSSASPRGPNGSGASMRKSSPAG